MFTQCTVGFFVEVHELDDVSGENFQRGREGIYPQGLCSGIPVVTVKKKVDESQR